MCVGAKEESVAAVCRPPEHTNNRLLVVKPRLPRNVVPSSRVNLNLYWEKLESAYVSPGMAPTSWRSRLLYLANVPGIGQGHVNGTTGLPIADAGPIFGFLLCPKL